MPLGKSILVGSIVLAFGPAFGATVDFNREIRPILADHCIQCHGPDEKNRKGDRRLDLRPEAVAEHDGVQAIAPGHPELSDLVIRILSADPDEIMPPKKAKKPLTEAQKELLGRWVAEGAEYQNHWAFLPRLTPPVPTPSGTGQTWIRHPIDSFVWEKLVANQLEPSPEADRRTLLRRLSFDLLGLPPTAAELEVFVADPRPEAYPETVERLLRSPHFGERWGRHWLDLARYADSDGYEKDTPRPYAYLFRDWVIDAINSDLPFDQFTIAQLAGDLLPESTPAQKIATAFHRQTLTNREGGVDKEEFRCKATVDRVGTTATAWLGLSMACAECHTHKFDPITHREFYEFYSFFNDASEKEIPAPTEEETAQFTRASALWEKKLGKLEEPLQAYLKQEVAEKLPLWEQSLQLPPERWSVLKPAKLSAIIEGSEEQFNPQPDGSIRVRDKDGVRTRFRVDLAASAGTTGFRLEALAEPGQPVGDAKTGGFGLSEFFVELDLGTGETRRLPLVRAASDFSEASHEIAKTIDGDRTTHWAIAPQTKDSHVAVFELAQPLVLPPNARLTVHLEFFAVGVMNLFRLAATSTPGPLTPDLLPDSIRTLVETPPSARSPEQTAKLVRYYAERIDETGRKLNEAVLAHQSTKPRLKPTMASVMVADPRPTQIHLRGDFLQKGEAVTPGTPAFLPPLQARGPRPDRLDLARWLVAPENPLTARVTVNHVWRHLFGRGLVPTENDFGTRGDPPSHPELLDWLASSFATGTDKPWSLKAIIRQSVGSATYRQSSHWRPDLAERDPLNLLLARQNRFRLEAETVRDVSLAVSGLLNPKVGGPSIKPALPADLAALSYASGMKWEETKGPEKNRRGLYIHFQRTVPFPMLMTFDSPEASVICTRRDRSNTPLQALTLLNNSAFVECAQALGQSLAQKLATNPGSLTDQIRIGFLTVTGRPPLPAELLALERFYQLQKAAFTKDPAAASLFLKTPAGPETIERASLAALSRILLNLDEVITRD